MGVTRRDPRTDLGASRVEQGKSGKWLVAAQDGGDLSPGDAGFASPGHRRCDVLVDEISGRVTRANQLVEVGQGHGVENVEIVCAKSHGQIFALTPRCCDSRGPKRQIEGRPVWVRKGVSRDQEASCRMARRPT